jgi:hypothetical protein
VNSIYAPDATVERTRFSRPHAVALLGPLISMGGIVWAILQPYRLTILHPRGEGFWWLVAEPPLLVFVVGALFALVVARPLLEDLEEGRAAAR